MSSAGFKIKNSNVRRKENSETRYEFEIMTHYQVTVSRDDVNNAKRENY